MDNTLLVKPVSVQKAVYGSISGISPVLANEICYRADIDGDSAVASLTPVQQSSLYGELVRLKNQIETHAFFPNIIYEGKAPKEFVVLEVIFSDIHMESVRRNIVKRFTFALTFFLISAMTFHVTALD